MQCSDDSRGQITFVHTPHNRNFLKPKHSQKFHKLSFHKRLHKDQQLDHMFGNKQDLQNLLALTISNNEHEAPHASFCYVQQTRFTNLLVLTFSNNEHEAPHASFCYVQREFL